MSSKYRLQVLQNKWQFKQRIKPLDEKLDFLHVNQIRFFEEAKYIFSRVHCLQLAILDDYYKFVNNVSRLRLRSVNDDKLYQPLYKKKSCQNSIKYKRVRTWNSLPKNIKTLSFVKFKKRCRQYVKNSMNN